MYEVYKVIVLHYLEDENCDRHNLEEPIICSQIFDRRFGIPSSVVLNEIFDRARDYALNRAMER